jgi:hypothetical protein
LKSWARSSASKLGRSRGEDARARGACELADILRLPESFSRDDLNAAYRRGKACAPESGGREGLLRAVNPARDVLRFMRFERGRGRHEGARIPVVARYGDPECQIIKERHLRHQATPLKDLGARFSVSGESVRQMEMKAFKAMRGMAIAERAARRAAAVRSAPLIRKSQQHVGTTLLRRAPANKILAAQLVKLRQELRLRHKPRFVFCYYLCASRLCRSGKDCPIRSDARHRGRCRPGHADAFC